MHVVLGEIVELIVAVLPLLTHLRSNGRFLGIFQVIE